LGNQTPNMTEQYPLATAMLSSVIKAGDVNAINYFVVVRYEGELNDEHKEVH